MNTSKQTTQQSSSTQPWKPQGDALKLAFKDAQTAYGTANDATAPTDFTAGMTPEQLATFHQMIGYGSNVPGTSATTDAGNALATAGSGAASGALDRLGAFDPSSTNNMGANIAGANQYAAGLDIPGAVQAAMRDATQTAHDVTIPGMESTAAGNGNINSSRTGLAEGLVQRGLAQKAADLSATMRNDAYATGANLASGTNTTNNNAILSALSGLISGGTGATVGGAGAAGSGVDTAGKLFNIAGTGGTGLQQNDQLALTNALQQYTSKVSSPYDALQGLMSIIGTNNWGGSSTGTSTTTSTPSALQTIGGIASGVGSLFSLSDKNLKTDIARIGATDDGIPIYRYRYMGRDRYEIGFLAQEVEKINPDAVKEVGGIKFVDYGEATKHLI